MYYMGGKVRQGKAIAGLVAQVLDDRPYVEPFCGALGAFAQVASHTKSEVILNDASTPVMRMWQFLHQCLDLDDVIPEYITEEDYYAMKEAGDVGDWHYAYIGHGMSFGGRWWGSYAKEVKGQTVPSYHRGARLKLNTISRTNAMLEIGDKLSLLNNSYDEIDLPPNSLIYCDPPYQGRSNGYSTTEPFDSDSFWNWCRAKSADGHIVLVSEYHYPEDFVEVLVLNGIHAMLNGKAKGSAGEREIVVCHISQVGFF